LKKHATPNLRRAAVVAALLVAAASFAKEPRLKVALTFDDLPINGQVPAGISLTQITRDTVAVLKRHHVPASYGFVNAKKLEGNPDGAEALKAWIAAGNPVASHTYTHIDLTKNSAEDFERDVLQNEPALQLLTPAGAKHDWRWLRYPFLHEGDTLEKRRAIRAFLAAHGYRIAQTTLDWEDYIWNSAYARCLDRGDAASIDWLVESYLAAARDFMRFQRANSRAIFGRDIHHVMLLHLGAFSARILPGLFKLLDREGYELVTLEEAQRDPAYEYDPDVADRRGGTLVELAMLARQVPWPADAPRLPRERLDSICKQ
jgi:peptidoglycan/xylan/chitin deacetylase (PgdA/CDA1 family)